MKKFSELFSAFDYIDEVIYICDMDTYDLVYCNKKLQGNLMAAYEENRTGYKCYKCLHGLDHPCVFCNNDSLRKNKRCIWSRLHPQTGKNYLLYDSVITIEGKEYRMELAVDSTHLEEAAFHTRQKLDMETHLTDCVRQLVKSGNFSDAVSAVLQTVLNCYGGERAYMFEFNRKKNIASNTFEICEPGVEPRIDNLQEIPLERMHIWLSIFEKKGILSIEDSELVKTVPGRLEEYRNLKAQGIKSVIAVPILSEEEIIGFVGVDNPSVNFENTDFLVDLAYFLGAEIGKNNIVKELQDQSFHDSLTGIYNRKGFEHMIENETGASLPLAFLIVDVDNFKMFNDTYGHAMGDEILKETANLLNSVFRSEDTVFRLGGDEFAVLLSNCDTSVWKNICSKCCLAH